jgi:hypothetical protein
MKNWEGAPGTETTALITGSSTAVLATFQCGIPLDFAPNQFFRLSVTDNNPPPVAIVGLEIISAIYGFQTQTADVTQLLQSDVTNNSLNINVNNSTMGGDPAFGHVKSLTVIYQYAGSQLTKTVSEGQTLTLP